MLSFEREREREREASATLRCLGVDAQSAKSFDGAASCAEENDRDELFKIKKDEDV